MDIQNGKIKGGFCLGCVVEIQQSEGGAAVADEDLVAVEISVSEYEWIRCRRQQIPCHFPCSGT
jgi:hypothetical protein